MHTAFPSGPHEANCNKASATVLQACINREQKKRSNHYQTVKTGTLFSIASQDRMYLHDPLLHEDLVKSKGKPKTFHC